MIGFLVALAALVGTRSAHATAPHAGSAAYREQILVPGGSYHIGTDKIWFPQDAEGPAKLVSVESFVLDKYEVSNDRFAEFVEDTGYVTETERFGWSFVHEKAMDKQTVNEITRAVQQVPWWLPVDNASWFKPEGERSGIAGRGDHPVVHMSHRDAEAFCAWAMPGGRLPTEVEWERAARGGKANRTFVWGNKLLPGRKHRANIWQGQFPDRNTERDGYSWASPVTAFGEQNQWGFHGVAGNVWEWTSDEWCDAKRPAPDCRRHRRPEDEGEVEYVKKGGSFLCHKSYCYRYRVAARTKNTANSAAYNLGFRCARDASPEEITRLGASESAVQLDAPTVGHADAPDTAAMGPNEFTSYTAGQDREPKEPKEEL